MLEGLGSGFPVVFASLAGVLWGYIGLVVVMENEMDKKKEKELETPVLGWLLHAPHSKP